MKRRIALLLVICLLTSMAPAATAGGAVDDGILDNEIELVDVGEQDLAGPLESDGIELDSDGLPDEIGDILPGGDGPDLELGDSLALQDGEALLSESETQGDASEANDDSSDFTIEDGVLIKYNGAGGDVVIPDGVKEIGSQAFWECIGMVSVTIPAGVTIIGDVAFYKCENLKEVTIPDGVIRIGEEVFGSCTSLVSVTIPNSVTDLGDSAFYWCTALREANLPNGLARVGNNTFHFTSMIALQDTVSRQKSR